MPKELTKEDLRNILNLIAIAPIKGNEAMVVAQLQQKLTALINKTEDVKNSK